KVITVISLKNHHNFTEFLTNIVLLKKCDRISIHQVATTTYPVKPFALLVHFPPRPISLQNPKNHNQTFVFCLMQLDSLFDTSKVQVDALKG
ncbi:hypothetical protein, partial [Nostoc sp.]|uniref:hypothetical protein n=1 Tax=Nostoc sp. TaxID=1180 RepID=UPI002FFB9FC0